MYEKESIENVAVNNSDLLSGDVSSGGSDSQVFTLDDGYNGSDNLHVSGGDAVSSNGDQQIRATVSDVSSSDSLYVAVSDLYSASGSCACGESAADLSALVSKSDEISGLVLLVFLFLILSWTENKFRLALSVFRERRR